MLLKIFLVLLALAAVYGEHRLRFTFFHGTDPVQSTVYTAFNLNNLLSHSSFRRNVKTVMFHYSEGQTMSTSEVIDVISAYSLNRNYNFVVINYEDNRIIGTDTAVDLAEGIASALMRFFDAGYMSGDMNLLGFSLGAQIVARAARRIQSRSSRRHIIGRLTGLDPANMGPISTLRIGRLSSADAQWVESIHTENPNRGDHDSFGHVQFYFNGGASQPQCTSISPFARWDCSHEFSLTYWAESVRSSNLTFPALQCNGWDLFLIGGCNFNEVGHMGRSTEPHLRGPYFLRTNLNAPYARNTPLP